ncbi:MAG: hypothetical protein CMI79_00670 [Candidatus Pelagibacter sp.]|nr:hypothetical protein [Candidatus Pelagibacter sp.]|tara:strand:- start:26408 stop:28666 length:2259 start_codon:yes stop_codon:yes gene_type:complete
MKEYTIIIGKRSNLSNRLNIKIKGSIVFSSNSFLKSDFLEIKNQNKKVNLIINNFYPASKLNKDLDFNLFLKNSFLTLKKIISTFPPKKINKLIYTSSSSVYGLTNIDLSNDNFSKKEIYSLTKLLCEKILIEFAKKNKVNFTIARVFNIYGGSDKFSIIEKIIKSCLKKNILNLNNNGESIRDFIHVDEVCEIYKFLIKSRSEKICDVGNGYGYKIIDIISSLNSKKIRIRNRRVKEQDLSIANTNFIIKKKINLIQYIHSKVGIKTKYNIKKIHPDKYLSLINKKITGSVIYGAGNAGKQVCDLILKNNSDGVFCFIDDDQKKIGKSYNGKIILSIEDLKFLSAKQKVPNIILAIPSLDTKKLKKLYNSLNKISSSVSNLPLKSELNSDIISLNDLQNSEFINIFEKRNLAIAKNYSENFKNKKILITGAGGSIGSELVLQLSKIVKKKIICLDFSEFFLFHLKNNQDLNQTKLDLVLGDINDGHLIEEIIKKNKVDLVFHAAAYKHLNLLEENPLQAIKNNILGTYNLINSIETATSKKIKFINISTDKAVRATSILGLSKRISEIICESYKLHKKTKIMISNVRFGNVFGSRGSVINLFLEKLNKGENINLTNKNVKRFFMSINEACNLVIAASQLNKNFKTLILDMGNPIKIVSLLNKMINLKKSLNKNFKIKINEVGLNKGEKMVEELSINNQIKETNISRVFEVSDPKYSRKDIDKLLLNIKKIVDTNSVNKIIPLLKNFLKNEL